MIEPFGAGTKSGYWYVAGRDLDRKEERLFRLDRFDSEVTVQGKPSAYEIPESFIMSKALSVPEEQQIATIKVRRDKAHSLRLKAVSVAEGDDWSTLEIPFVRDFELLSDVLWHGADAVILAPENLRQSAITALTEIAQLHG